MSRVLVVLALCGWLLFIWNIVPFRRTSDSVLTEGCDCRHHCEWQLAKMNETCNILIAVCEEKLQKLHGSDMNMAIIREQLHKEILELFWYEFQTFRRLHSSKSESVPQLCSEYCSKVKLKVHEEEYQEKMRRLRTENQQLVQTQRWLKLQLQRRLLDTRANTNSDDIDHSMLGSINTSAVIFLTTLAVLIAVFVRVHQQSKDRVAVIETEKGRVEAEVCTLADCNNSQAAVIQFLKTQQQEIEEQNTSLKKIAKGLVDRNALLESWNVELFDELDNSQQTFQSKMTELQLEVERLSLKCKEFVQKLARRETELRNAHKFWQKQQSEERKAQQNFKREQESVINSLEQHALKCQWKLTTMYRKSVTELKGKLMRDNETHVNEKQMLIKRQRDLEVTIRKLEKEATVHMRELERCRMDRDMEKESKKRAQAQVSRLERQTAALKVQTARLEEGVQQARSYRRSRPPLFSSAQHQDQTSQTPNSLQLLDSRIEVMRQDFETRLSQLQTKFDNQQTRDSEELQVLRTEYEELCKKLEIANKRNADLERRLAYQEPIRSLVQCPATHRNEGSRHAHMQTRARLRRHRSRASSIKLTGDDDFRTQPVSTPYSSICDLTEYQLSDVCY